MLKKVLLLVVILFFSGINAQERVSLYQTKKISSQKDSIQIELENLNSSYFEILDSNQKIIDSSFYKVNFEKGLLVLKKHFPFSLDSISVNYLKFPSFLTKEYKNYDVSRLISHEATNQNLYQFENSIIQTKIPFDGLTTSGSITRGITVGSNQNSVLNSNLDLQISGKLSEKVSLRASLQDSTIPLQEGGYSQKLDQFDTVFMELFSDSWAIRAGDIFLENNKTQFLSFNKKVQGISANFDLGNQENKTNVFATASLVRGQYTKSSFIGQEGNQGPYKLKGQNGELYVVIVSGSERVYVNGILLKRGENNQYTIDYNAGEILFTTLFTITSEMRITIEYQYSDRNYTRFVTYAGGSHETKKWNFGGYLYSENDLKNQPLQQSLSTEQATILAAAGDDQTLMNSPSAYLDSYSENKILYKKTVANDVEIFENSNNPLDELYTVKFSLVGEKKGNYRLKNTNSINKIYEYTAPVNSIPQGNYEPILPLVAPTKIQIATFLGGFKPSETTAVDFEIGVSHSDKNLFSSLNDNDNKGIATKIKAKHRLFSKKWKGDVFSNLQFVQRNFSPIERLYTIEFDRDWNSSAVLSGQQRYWVSGLKMSLPDKGILNYQFEKLDYAEKFSGNRHLVQADFKLQKWIIQNQGSYLNSDSNSSTSQFLRNQSQIRFHHKKNWIGSSFRLEDNQEKIKTTNQLSGLSQRFSEYGFVTGRGDSTKVFVELGYLKRTNDSLQNGILQKVNHSHTYRFNSKLIQTQKSDLSIFANYRVLSYKNSSNEKQNSLNSRILYNDRFFSQFVQTTTSFETNSGSLPQQEFTYLEVDSGQGVYTWNDYNNNGIQELQEFEVAPFVDQAQFIKIFLPNQVYVKTHQNKLSLSFILNPYLWQNKTGFKKWLSHLYNQTSYIVDRKTRNEGTNFDLKPFGNRGDNVLGLNSNFRNSLFFNRGKQLHSSTYTFIENQNTNLLSVGSQNAKNRAHQLQYNHLYQKSWLFGLFAQIGMTSLVSENYTEKNYAIKSFEWVPKISYLFSKSTSLDLFYELKNKKNQIENIETLLQNRFGTSFSYTSQKNLTWNGEISFYQNKFNGNEQSSVGFQMLEGLQKGRNLTWRCILQKKLTDFLDINLNYQGRKSEANRAIHNGNIQLRAYF
jgi:hypothetical protein